MREKIVNKLINFLKKYKTYTNDEEEILKYGLESLYILITKSVIIFSIAFLLNIGFEVLIFALIYNLIRKYSFGLHATKSWICLVSSLFIFLIIPLVCKYIVINIYLKSIIGAFFITQIYINSPADTYKRPIINQKRRNRFKFLSTIIAIILIFTSILINNNFISNCCLFSVILQSFIISPYIYKLFKLPYNNYLNYINNNLKDA